MLSDDPLVGLVQRNLARSLLAILAHDPGVRRGKDPEEVHQYRVAIRKIRSDFHTFSPLFVKATTTELSGELGWLGSIVGAVRDNDVLAQRLHKDAVRCVKTDAAGLQLLFSSLSSERSANRATMFAALGAPRYLGVLDALIKFANEPSLRPLNTSKSHTGVARAAAKFVRKPWSRLAATVDKLGTHPSDTSLHRVRILAKRTRYAAAAVTSVIDDAGQFATDLAELQTELGDHQDAVIAESWLRDFAVEFPAGALVARELIVVQRLRQQSARDEWPRIWESLTTNKLPSWL